jgi:hypothetical protein
MGNGRLRIADCRFQLADFGSRRASSLQSAIRNLKSAMTFVAVLLLSTTTAFAQRVPALAYVFPAGGQRGTSLNLTVGGQALVDPIVAIISGEGVSVEIIEYLAPLNGKQVQDLREKVSEAHQKVRKAREDNEQARRVGYQQLLAAALREVEVTEAQYKALMEFNLDRADPKRQVTPQLDEQVVVKLTIDRDATPGPRELRLVTKRGVSNTVRLHIGQFTEVVEHEPEQPAIHTEKVSQPLPFVINGQVMPGDVDRFRFAAKRGDRLVIDAAARSLVPYLADAVPGWFQATVTLYDGRGNELAFADDFRFNPDPVFLFEVPRDGDYIVEIRDSIYRGREDFVYRITVGKRPFVTSVFPLGAQQGQRVNARILGWNLPVKTALLDTEQGLPLERALYVPNRAVISNAAAYVVGDLPEITESEPNDPPGHAAMVQWPVIINGRIDRAGDRDAFAFHAAKNDWVVAEVTARRLNSPLDSILRLVDSGGNTIEVNDDHVDAAAGLMTHHADSYLHVKIPADGDYVLHLADAQQQDGEEYAYRLRISPPRPDFELRVAPGAITAAPGEIVTIEVFALRRDGFSGRIDLSLKDAPEGFALGGAWVAPGLDKVRLSLLVPPDAQPDQLVRLTMIGTVEKGEQTIQRQACPAEDMMQAFIYHHLVPTEDWVVAVRGRKRPVLAIEPDGLIKLTPNAPATVKVAVPKWLVERVVLRLSDPPQGVTLGRVTPCDGGLTLQVRVDEANHTPGFAGNLIVDVLVKPEQKEGQPRRGPAAYGILPAIAFEM